MAMQDYFIPCYKLETKTVSDGLGGYETVEYIGIAFKGLPVKKGDTEQLVGALRGSAGTQFNFHCPSNVPLKKDDKIMYEEDGKNQYIRLSSEPHIIEYADRLEDVRGGNVQSHVDCEGLKWRE